MSEIEFKSDVKLSSHTISASLTHMNPIHLTYNSGPLWVLLGIWLWSVICRILGWNVIDMVKKDEKEGDDD